MRVVLVTDDHPPMVGGIALFVARVGEELVRRGHEVVVVARGRPDLAAVPGTRLVPIRGPFRPTRMALRTALLRADRVLATTWPVATGLARFGVPFDVVAHGSDVTRPPRDPRAMDLGWGRAERRWAMSGFLASQAPARWAPPEVLPAPVPVAEAPPGRGEGWTLVARATPLKGGDRFVRWVAAAGVDGRVVGDGPELPRWRALAAELGARVTFHGARSPRETLELLRGSALAVLAPRADADGTGAEGFGLALVEAMGQGVPAVGCRTGGVPEAVGPGLIVDDPDDARACADAIARWGPPADAGVEALGWVRERHGVTRTVDALLRG